MFPIWRKIMEWKEYPAGAELHLFNGLMNIYVCKEGHYWVAQSIPGSPVYGCVVLARGVDKKKVMKNTENWIAEQAKIIVDSYISTYFLVEGNNK
jgi:hypothetical protein